MHIHSPSWFVLSSEATANIHVDSLITAICFTGLATCMVALRWYSRVCSTSCGVKLEDYLVTVALVLSIGNTAVIGGEYKIDGEPRGDPASQHSSFPTMMKLVFAQSIFYHLSVNLVKASFVLQYTRLFTVFPPTLYSCYTILVALLGATGWGVFGVIFLCDPVHKYWDMAAVGTCMDAETHFWSTSIIGIILDWMIWVLPIPVVGKLKLPRRQKIDLLVVFGLGGFVCIVSILRLVLVHEYAHRQQVSKSGTYAVILSTIEINVALSCVSMLVLKPLLARYMPAVVSEQPLTAREDLRRWSHLTIMVRAALDEDEDVEKANRNKRRDTMVSTMEPTHLKGSRRVEGPSWTRGYMKRSKSF